MIYGPGIILLFQIKLEHIGTIHIFQPNTVMAFGKVTYEFDIYISELEFIVVPWLFMVR